MEDCGQNRESGAHQSFFYHKLYVKRLHYAVLYSVQCYIYKILGASFMLHCEYKYPPLHKETVFPI